MDHRPNATLAEILAIPGNCPVFDSLAQLLREQQLGAFVGAATSSGLSLLWDQFIERDHRCPGARRRDRLAQQSRVAPPARRERLRRTVG